MFPFRFWRRTPWPLWAKTELWLFIREYFFAWTRTTGLVPIRIASPSRQETFSVCHATRLARTQTSGLHAQFVHAKDTSFIGSWRKASADSSAIGAFRTGVGTNRSELPSVIPLNCSNPKETRVFSRHLSDGTPLAKGQPESPNASNIGSIIRAIAVSPFTRSGELRVGDYFW